MKIKPDLNAQNISNIVPPRAQALAAPAATPTTTGSKIGPAVVLNLSNTSKAPDAAAGDPDHDGH